jgi:hypothetical protein
LGKESLSGASMADSIRQKIIDAIKARFTALTVSEWRDLERNPFQQSELPAVNLRDATEEISILTWGRDLRILMVMLEMAVVESTDGPKEVRKVMADLEVSVNTGRTWGGLALESELMLSEMAIEHLENKIMIARIPLKIQFITAQGNPYSQA